MTAQQNTADVFDVVKADLAGAMLIQASAGTGKTYSLEHVVVRLVVERELPLDRILIVTFTKAATAELVARVQAIFKRLSRVKDPGALDDPTERSLYARWRDQGLDGDAVRGRVKAAIDTIDETSIYTLHSFCQRMLIENTFARGANYGAAVGSDDELLAQAAQEALREIIRRNPDLGRVRPLLEHPALEDLVRRLAANPEGADVKVENNSDDPSREDLEELFLGFAGIARRRFAELKKQAGLLTFDDMIAGMDALVTRGLQDAESAAASAVAAIRDRFDAVLIDEFQDTDRLQYEIFKKLFVEDGARAKTVFFVGDPKQAIYRFRAADIEVYMEAQKDFNDSNRFVLACNHRSTPALVEAVNAWFEDREGSRDHFGAGSGISFVASQTDKGKLPLFRCRQENGAWTASPLPALAVLSNTTGENARPGDTKADAKAAETNCLVQDIKALLSGDIYIR
ncbi:MAG: UvrD-helicase domain-containing protein, partial [Duodenibacillus sp.]|nr:UvrD-helicase domain-containing protein [Duodenibacillus sp.]